MKGSSFGFGLLWKIEEVPEELGLLQMVQNVTKLFADFDESVM
jgi:hypothetical protein